MYSGKTFLKQDFRRILPCVVFNMQPHMYLMGGRAYGCLYHDLYSDDYTELCVITFTKTITLDRCNNVGSESGLGNNRQRVIKTDSYFSSTLIDHFFMTVFYEIKSLVWRCFLLQQLNLLELEIGNITANA